LAWLNHPHIQRLKAMGYQLSSPEEISPLLEKAFGLKDSTAADLLFSIAGEEIANIESCMMDSREQPDLWGIAIKLRDLPLAEVLIRHLGADTERRKYIWSGVYQSETPLVRCLKTGWVEGAETLKKAGARTKKIIAYTNRHGRTEYHDIQALEQEAKNLSSQAEAKEKRT